MNTLKMYDDFLANGYSEVQARCAVNNFDLIIDDLATKDDLKQAIKQLESDLKIFFSSKSNTVENLCL